MNTHLLLNGEGKVQSIWVVVESNSTCLTSEYCRGVSGGFKERGSQKVVDNHGEEGGGDDQLGGDQGLPRLDVQSDHEDQADQGGSASSVCSVNDHLPEANMGLQTTQNRS